MLLETRPLELRGIANKYSKNGKLYYIINVEDNDGSPHAFYCANADALQSGLCKGDMVILTIELKEFNRKTELVVVKLEKVED